MRNALVLGLVFFVLSTLTAAATYQQVRVIATDKGDFERLAGLDIVTVVPREYLEVIVDSVGFNLIKATGLPFEVIHEDLAAFYQSRYPVGTTMGGFRTYAEVMAALDSLSNAYFSLVSARVSIGQSHEGRGLWMVKVSDNVGIDEDEPEIFINGVHHAREPVTSEVCVEFIRNLVQGYGSDPECTELVDNNEFFILPIVNPDGYEYNRQTDPGGGGMWRKNRRNNGDGTYGIDVNRNYPYMWAYDDNGSSGSTWSEVYRGPAPGSEPEIQAVMAFVQSRDFAWVMNYHSYGNYVLWPWGYYDGVNEEVATFWELFGNYGEDTLGYSAGTPWQLLYNTNGDANDWGWGERRTRGKYYAMTIEVGNDYDGFWPPPDRIPTLVNENVQAMRNFAHKAYEIYKRRRPPAPEIIGPTTAPAGQAFHLHWQTADIDTFNLASSYRVMEKFGLQRITQPCEQIANFELSGFALSSARKHGGTYSLYSGQANNYRATAKFQERLAVQIGDTLTFWTWYDMEQDWDYAYVEVTTGGESWVPINGNRSSVTNPHNHNEGFGITGNSGGWVLAKYPLIAYVGQEIEVRFRYWTDGAVINEGIYIDDIYPFEAFASSVVLTEYAYQESLLVGPYSIGDYVFQVAARDDRGDLSYLSPRFAVNVVGELYSLSGLVNLDDSPPSLAGSVVTISPLGFIDTTDVAGHYSFPNIPSGTYSIAASRAGYFDSVVTGFTINSDTSLSFLLQPIVPATPVLVSPANGSTVNFYFVSFNWQDAQYADGYIIQIASDSLFSQVVEYDSSLAVSQYTNADPLIDGLYFWRVTAFTDFGRYATSATWAFTVDFSLSPPQLIAPADTAVVDNFRVTFDWSDVPYATGYVIEIAADSEFANIAAFDSSRAVSGWLSPALYNGTYYWRVTAFNAVEFSPRSETRDFQVLVTLDPPQLISPVDDFISDTASIDFSWHFVDGALVYIFELAADSTFSGIVEVDSGILDSQYTNVAFLSSGDYYWRVTARGWTVYSAPSTFRHLQVALPWDSERPVLLSPGDGYISPEPYIDFSWQPVSEAVAYLFELAADEGFSIMIVRDSSVTANAYSSDSLANAWFWWRVKASNGADWTIYSDAWSFLVNYDTSGQNFVPGDANGDGHVMGSDVTYLVGFFRGANPPPDPYLAGDANGDCEILGSDVTYLVRYLRGVGEPPVMGDCVVFLNKPDNTADSIDE